jgi:hypothetical protein
MVGLKMIEMLTRTATRWMNFSIACEKNENNTAQYEFSISSPS